jgi:preprotein translocase subunit SecF
MLSLASLRTNSFDLLTRRRRWYILSLVLLLPGIISLAVRGIHVGIDFKGGVLQQVSYLETRPSESTLREKLASTEIQGLTLQTAGDKGILLRYPVQGEVLMRDTGNAILAALGSEGTVKETAFESIGSSVARATTLNAFYSVLLTSVAIMLFIAWSFRAVPKSTSSWRFGVTAIAALLHDLLFVIGAFSLIGIFFPQVEVDSLFITALLTVLGFSLNDTIVVFDRIRENLLQQPEADFIDVANDSLNQTIGRSLSTSLAVLLVLVALLLLGGDSIRNFMLALTLGVAVGTYSSIFAATPLLVSWQLWAQNRTPRVKKERKPKEKKPATKSEARKLPSILPKKAVAPATAKQPKFTKKGRR